MDIIFNQDEYTNKGDVERLKEYDRAIKHYNLKRTRGRMADTWTGMMADTFSAVVRPHMKKFLEKEGFYMK